MLHITNYILNIFCNNQWKSKINGLGIQLGDAFLYILRFAVYQVVIANDKDSTEYMMRKLIEAYNKWELSLNIKNTNYLCIETEVILNDHEKRELVINIRYLGVIYDSSYREYSAAKRALTCLTDIL